MTAGSQTTEGGRPLRRWRWLAALVGALGMRFALAPESLVPLGFVAFVPALVLARRLPARGRFALGWWMAFGCELPLFWFIGFTIEMMTPLPAIAGVGMAVAYAAWHALAGGLFLWLSEPLRLAAERRVHGLGPVAIAAAFAAVEWGFPQLFPWSVGHVTAQVEPLAAVMALGGVPTAAFVVVLVSALIAEGITRRQIRHAWPSLAVLGALLAFGVGWSLFLGAASSEQRLRVAVVQLNTTLEEKRRASGRIDPGQELSQRVALLKRLETQLRALPPNTYDLVVASEGSYPLWWRVDADEVPRVARQGGLSLEATRVVQAAVAEGPHTHTIVGGLRRGDDGRTRNSAVHFAPDGRLLDFYDKRTLVPFSEYLPTRDLFPELRIPGISDVGAGDRPCAFDVAGVPVACGICYEAVFAGPTRADIGDSRLLVNLTIDTWFGTTNAPHAHLMMQASRAIELGVPLVRSALTGITAVVGPDGQVSAALPVDTAGVLDAEVPLWDVATPYRALGPVLPWLWVALTGLLGADAWLARRRRRVA